MPARPMRGGQRLPKIRASGFLGNGGPFGVTQNLERGTPLFKRALRVGAGLLALAPIPAAAIEIDTGLGTDIEWDNSLRFSLADQPNGEARISNYACELEVQGPAALSPRHCVRNYDLEAERGDFTT